MTTKLCDFCGKEITREDKYLTLKLHYIDDEGLIVNKPAHDICLECFSRGLLLGERRWVYADTGEDSRV